MPLRGGKAPREGAGPLPALLDQGSLPDQLPAPLGRNTSQKKLSARGRGGPYVVGETTPTHHLFRLNDGGVDAASRERSGAPSTQPLMGRRTRMDYYDAAL